MDADDSCTKQNGCHAESFLHEERFIGSLGQAAVGSLGGGSEGADVG